jgi:hypothetical protein
VAEFDSVIPAGGSGTLTARIETTVVQHGKVSKSVTVQTDAPAQDTVRLVINFEAVASIIAAPRLRLHLNAVEGERGSARILLHRPDGERLAISPTPQEPGEFPVDLKIVGIPVSETTALSGGGRAVPGDVWLEAVMAPHGEPVRWTGRVRVETNHPDAALLEVPISVWVRPVFDVRPQRVNLWIPEDASEMQPVTVRVTHAARKPFEVTNIEVSHPELFSATALTTSARRFHTIRVQLNDGVDVSKIHDMIKGSLRLHSSDPAEPVIDIQVGLSPVQARARQPAARGGTPSVDGSVEPGSPVGNG